MTKAQFPVGLDSRVKSSVLLAHLDLACRSFQKALTGSGAGLLNWRIPLLDLAKLINAAS